MKHKNSRATSFNFFSVKILLETAYLEKKITTKSKKSKKPELI
jgi:hypothetical protein